MPCATPRPRVAARHALALAVEHRAVDAFEIPDMTFERRRRRPEPVVGGPPEPRRNLGRTADAVDSWRARSPTSPPRNQKPSTPSVTQSRAPLVSGRSTARPSAAASATTSPCSSNHNDGSTSTRACRNRRRTSSAGTQPVVVRRRTPCAHGGRLLAVADEDTGRPQPLQAVGQEQRALLGRQPADIDHRVVGRDIHRRPWWRDGEVGDVMQPAVARQQVAELALGRRRDGDEVAVVDRQPAEPGLHDLASDPPELVDIARAGRSWWRRMPPTAAADRSTGRRRDGTGFRWGTRSGSRGAW